MAELTVRIQTEPFDFAMEMTKFGETIGSSGAMVTFNGIVRDEGDSIDYILIEHYPVMTEKVLKNFSEKAITRFHLEEVLIIHRYGALKPGEIIMMVATAAKHRHDAFFGAQFLMDFLKSRAPFWKKEISRGQEKWVQAKIEDEAALQLWN